MNNNVNYKVFRNFIDPEIVIVLQNYFEIFLQRIYGDEKFFKSILASEKDVGEGCAYYGDLLCETMSMLYGPKLCVKMGLNISPTYTSVRIYQKGNKLIPHVDRPACEYSLTIPILISDGRCSTIYLSDKRIEDTKKRIVTYDEVKSGGNFKKFDLMPGDALFYKGMDYYHWREPLESDYLVQFFLHFVDSKGKYKHLLYDTRPYMGYPASSRADIDHSEL